MKRSNPRVCFVVTTPLPIPNIHGGAIEALVTQIIDQNEIFKRLDISVVTVIDEKAEDLRKAYKHANFIRIPLTPSLKIRTQYLISRILKKLFNYNNVIKPLGMLARQRIQNRLNEFDVIINESSQIFTSVRDDPAAYPPIYQHLHWVDETDWIKTMPVIRGVISVSQYVNDKLPKNNIQEDSSFVLLNAIDQQLFKKPLDKDEVNALKSELGIKKEVVVLYVGRVMEEKGVLELIEGVNLVSKAGVDICLLLVGSSSFGSGHSLTAYEKQVEMACLQSQAKVIQIGYVPNEEIYKYQNISDMQIVPSKWQEAAGLVLLEAQASGLPLISTIRGGMPEYLGPDSGLMIDEYSKLPQNIADKIIMLASNPHLLAKMSTAGQHYASEYTPEKYYLSFVGIVEKIINKKVAHVES